MRDDERARRSLHARRRPRRASDLRSRARPDPAVQDLGARGVLRDAGRNRDEPGGALAAQDRARQCARASSAAEVARVGARPGYRPQHDGPGALRRRGDDHHRHDRRHCELHRQLLHGEHRPVGRARPAPAHLRPSAPPVARLLLAAPDGHAAVDADERCGDRAELRVRGHAVDRGRPHDHRRHGRRSCSGWTGISR